MLRVCVCLLGLSLYVLPISLGQVPDWGREDPSLKALIRSIYSRAQQITAQAAKECASKQTWELLREQRRRELAEMLGVDLARPRTPPKAQITGRIEKPRYVIEKVALETLPGFVVTANLYIPKDGKEQHPAVLYVCGHSFSPYGAKTQYQRHPISLAKNGYVALILDPIQISETYAIHHGITSYYFFDWYAVGYSPGAVEAWNAIRALDYLTTRPEVDSSRIGMTGRSGGAATTWYTAALDERVRVAVPVMGISSYAAYVYNDTQRFHCDCMFPVNFLRQDLIHMAALIAPRPLLAAHGTKDRLFPVEGYKAFEKLMTSLYASYGYPDRFRNLEVESGHQDSDFLREQAIKWFDRFLLGIENRVLDLQYEEELAPNLAVFSGHPPNGLRNHWIQEEFVERARLKMPSSASQWARRKEELEKVLKTKLLSGVEAALKFEPRVVERHETAVRRETWFIETEPAVTVRLEKESPGQVEETSPILIYIADDSETEATIASMLRGVRARDKVIRYVLYPRGYTGNPFDATLYRALVRNAMFVGETIESLRLVDVLQVIRLVSSDGSTKKRGLTIAARKNSTIMAILAGVLSSQVTQVCLIDPPETLEADATLLAARRFTDLAELAAMVAPRRLSFLRRYPPVYEWTRQIYELLGASDQFFVGMSLAGMAEGRRDHRFTTGL